MSKPSIMIAGIKSGSGKTLISCGIISYLKNKGLRVQAFKCGPDYIDPLFHRMVLEVPSINLDTWFSNEDELKALFDKTSKSCDLSVIEGVMGLYDGVLTEGGFPWEPGNGSAYDLAVKLKTPVILVADVKGMAQSMIPLIKGFTDYDKEGIIHGVILNKISNGFYKKILPMLEKELTVPVLGYLEVDNRLTLESRHLGLKLPLGKKGIETFKEKANLAGEALGAGVNMEALMGIARGGSLNKIPEGYGDSIQESLGDNIRESLGGNIREVPLTLLQIKKEAFRPVVYIARDEAFCFYYQENIRVLKDAGLEVKFISPLRDSEIPGDAGGLILVGGYPELFGKELSENTAMLKSVRDRILRGLPTLAECGGFMYLHNRIINGNGDECNMAGIIQGDVYKTNKSIRFGYSFLELDSGEFGTGKKDNSLLTIKGHEFHYYESTAPGTGALAFKPDAQNNDDKRPWGYVGRGVLWGFPHLYYPSCPDFICGFKAVIEGNILSGGV